MYRKLIVGVNFDSMSERAVAAALEFARGTNGAVVLVHVVSSAAQMQEPSGKPASIRPVFEQRLADAAQALSAQFGVQVDYGVVTGAAADEIVKYVKLWGGDAIVMGTEGRSGLGRILLGSVAEKVLKNSPVPVVVVGPHVEVTPVKI